MYPCPPGTIVLVASLSYPNHIIERNVYDFVKSFMSTG